jgi:hypothetical protein
MNRHKKLGIRERLDCPRPVIGAAYGTVTENTLLREAVFKGLREDQEVPPARPRPRPPGGTAANRF